MPELINVLVSDKVFAVEMASNYESYGSGSVIFISKPKSSPTRTRSGIHGYPTAGLAHAPLLLLIWYPPKVSIHAHQCSPTYKISTPQNLGCTEYMHCNFWNNEPKKHIISLNLKNLDVAVIRSFCNTITLVFIHIIISSNSQQIWMKTQRRPTWKLTQKWPKPAPTSSSSPHEKHRILAKQ